jgi:glycine/serine hydroxymethyltransferase
LKLNTVALTEKGMGQKEMKKLAKILSNAHKLNIKQEKQSK